MTIEELTAPVVQCEHKKWKCVGDHGVVCADCGHIISDGRGALQQALDILGFAFPGPRPWPTESTESKLQIYLNMAKAAAFEVAALRKDAERYRWMRDESRIVDEDGGWASHYRLPTLNRHNDSPNKLYRLPLRSLDAAIDAATKQEQS